MKRHRVAYSCIALLLLGVTALFLPASEVRIYGTIFYSLVSVDDTYGGTLKPKKVYASIRLEDRFPPFESELREPFRNLDQELQASVTRLAQEAGIDLIWIASRQVLQFRENGEIEGGGVLITFSEVDHYFVFSQASGSIHVARQAAGGGRYDFVRLFGSWRFLWKSGKWIS